MVTQLLSGSARIQAQALELQNIRALYYIYLYFLRYIGVSQHLLYFFSGPLPQRVEVTGQGLNLCQILSLLSHWGTPQDTVSL